MIKCPHCGEEMQAPVDRKSILCMFCGEKIDLAKMKGSVKTVEEEEADRKKSISDIAKIQDDLHFVLSQKAMCEGFSEKVKAFKRNSYHTLFEEHKAENYAFYTSVKRVLDNAAEDDLEAIFRQIANVFIEDQKEALAQVKKKNERFSHQMDKNMFMVIYVLPSIKEIRSERADRLAEAICREWRGAFKDSNIMASDYDTIMQGFKRKLCYVTTAVCRNLGKGEDCEELRLIKEFRDSYLASTKEGQALIEEYYDIAPTLVKRIAKDASAEEKYIWLWNTYLAPCVAYIRNGEPEHCKETYCSMMEELRAEYMGR